MKKIISFIAVVLSMLMLCSMFACGGSTRDGLLVTISDNERDIAIQYALQDAFVDYMKEKGKEVKVSYNTYSSSSYSQDLLNLQAGNKLGDVIQTSDSFAPLFAYKKVFEPLDEFISEDDSFDLSAYDSDIIKSARAYENKLYYMPRSYDQVVIFINTDFFDTLGVEYPKPDTTADDPWAWWTWDKCIDLCKEIRQKVAKHSKYGSVQDKIFPMDANIFWNPVYNAIIKSFGGKTVDVGDTITTGFNSTDPLYSKTLKAIEFIKYLSVNNFTTSSNDTRFLAKVGGKSGISSAGMWFTTRPNVLTCLNNKINLAFAPIPRFTKTQTEQTENTTYVGYGSAGYAVSAMSSQKTLAWEFVKFCASEQGQKIISGNGASVPTLNSLKNDASWKEPVKVDNAVVDQSAFLYDRLTRTLSTYARGVNAEVEYSIYQTVQSKIISGIKKEEETPALLCSSIYATIKDYLIK